MRLKQTCFALSRSNSAALVFKPPRPEYPPLPFSENAMTGMIIGIGFHRRRADCSRRGLRAGGELTIRARLAVDLQMADHTRC